YFGNAAFQLRILPPNFRARIVVDFNVRIDAVAFDNPFTLVVRQSGTRDEDLTAVDQWTAAPDAYDAAPRTFADERTQAGFPDHPGENITVSRGVLIQQRDHRSDEDAIGISIANVVSARVIHAQ